MIVSILSDDVGLEELCLLFRVFEESPLRLDGYLN